MRGRRQAWVSALWEAQHPPADAVHGHAQASRLTGSVWCCTLGRCPASRHGHFAARPLEHPAWGVWFYISCNMLRQPLLAYNVFHSPFTGEYIVHSASLTCQPLHSSRAKVPATSAGGRSDARPNSSTWVGSDESRSSTLRSVGSSERGAHLGLIGHLLQIQFFQDIATHNTGLAPSWIRRLVPSQLR